MAEIVDSCCVQSPIAGQLTKPDKNNNTTANVDDEIISTSEQSDVIDDVIDGKSENTGDNDTHRLSSGVDDDGNNNNNNHTVTTESTDVAASSSSSNDETEVVLNNESTISNNLNANTSTTSTDPYKDFSGVDTESFISTTLRNNPKDRTLLLKLENVLQQFIQNEEQTTHQFQAMNSYERMIVHRVAAFFGLDHNVDKNGQAVVVSKTANTRIPDFSFQKCIPDDESIDLTSGASTTDNPIASTINSTEIPTRRILRRHEKHPNHEHSQRNGVNDEHSNHQTTNKSQQVIKPYSERVNHYAETRARIFNDTSDSSNLTLTNKTNKANNHNNNNVKQYSNNYPRSSYRKNHPNSAQQHRSYTYQQTTHNHMQQYSAGKIIDPSSHMLNTSASRNPSIYSAQQPPSANLNLAQSAAIYASMVPSNPNATALRPQAGTPFYPQAQQTPVDYDYKQQTGGAAHIYNYVSMIPPTTSNFIQQQQQSQQATQSLHGQLASGTGPNQVPSQHGTGMGMPILVQQPTGQLQYIFPAHALPQQQQQQGQQPPPPSNSYPITPEGQYVPLFRPDPLSIPGPATVPPASVVDNNNTHHHQYPQNQAYHHHQISQQVPPQQPPPSQQQQPVPPSQSNPNPQPAPFVRLYPTGTPGNVSHPYAQAPYQTPPQATYVQPGPPFMIPPPQTAGGIQAYSTYDNSIPYNAYGPNTTPTPSTVTNTAGKSNVNNNGTSVQYATNHLSNLNLQNQHDDYQGRLITNPPTRFSHSNGSTNTNPQRNFIGRPLVQSPNGATNTPRMTMYSTSNQSYRHNRPGNLTNTDKQLTSIETDSKSLTSTQQQNNSENISLAGPAQE